MTLRHQRRIPLLLTSLIVAGLGVVGASQMM